MNIYVSNLDYGVQSDDLKSMFSPFGEVSSANIIMDRTTNRSRGFGFIEMPNQQEAEKAMSELNGSMQGGNAIKVTEARPREERPSRPSYN